MIYQPADDSYLLQETLEKFLVDKNKNFKILDLGSGTGILAQTCKKFGFNNILTADIDEKAVDFLKNKGFKAIQSNLFSDINKNKKFNLIIFNPPYLPEDSREPQDSKLQTTAGKKGYELIIRFLKQAENYLLKNGVILLLFSSLSKPNIILKKAKELNYEFNLLARKKLFFEELFVYEFCLRGN